MINSNSDMSKDNIFRTKHTDLAAYLITQGFALIDVDIDEDNYGRYRKPSVFLFDDTLDIRKEIRAYQTMKANVNAAQFFEAYRRCLRMTKIGKM